MRPPWVDPQTFRCRECHERNNGPAPALLSVEPVDPDAEDDSYFVVHRPLHLGRQECDALSAELRRQRSLSLHPQTTDPGRFHSDRGWDVFVATIDLRSGTAAGLGWDDPIDCKCRGCGRVPPNFTLGAIAKAVRKRNSVFFV